jgi:hypothetical protein
MSTDLREAAVASVLAGAVVIVLGYASGLGLRTPLVASVVQPPTPPVSVTAPPAVPPTAPVVPGTVFVPVVTRVEVPVPVHTYSAPTPTPSATPTPTEPPPVTCEPGLLGGLLAPVDSLLGGITAPVTCAVDGLLGSGCCPGTTTGLLRTGTSR